MKSYFSEQIIYAQSGNTIFTPMNRERVCIMPIIRRKSWMATRCSTIALGCPPVYGPYKWDTQTHAQTCVPNVNTFFLHPPGWLEALTHALSDLSITHGAHAFVCVCSRICVDMCIYILCTSEKNMLNCKYHGFVKGGSNNINMFFFLQLFIMFSPDVLPFLVPQYNLTSLLNKRYIAFLIWSNY